jgi:molybdopterin molybdotransferase
MSGRGTSPWGATGRPLISLDEAWAMIRAQLRPLPAVEIGVRDADGRVLVEPVHADEDSPPFNKSMMDGLAVRSADCAAAGAKLAVVGLATAGGGLIDELGAGQAVRINTGAPLPPGADCVVRIEDCELSADGRQSTIRTKAEPGKHVAPRGTVRRKGDLIVDAPRRLGPAQVGAAAAAGAAKLRVGGRPRVAVLATGDELVWAGATPREGQIHESNGPMLCAMVRRWGGEPIDRGIVADEPEAMRERLDEALGCHVVLVAGGMSMGTHDLVPSVCEKLGVRWLFHGVDLRPGKPVAFGLGPAGQHVFGLPGNPVSAYVCALIFARMAVWGLSGLPCEPPLRIAATLGDAMPAARDPRPAFLPATLAKADAGRLVARCSPWRGSADVFGLAEADALIYLSDPTQPRSAGDRVEVILMD